MSGDLTKCANIISMPQLRPRRESFCQAIIRSAKNGASIAKCYESAGYKTTGHASEVGASRLMSFDEVKGRLDELARPIMRKTAFTLETLSAEVAQTIADARKAGQHSTVIKGLELASKLHGLLTTKIDVEHSFADRAEAFQMIGKRHGEEVAAILREALERGADAVIERRAMRARDVSPSPARSEADIFLEEQPRRD
jgi:hypothetical protein